MFPYLVQSVLGNMKIKKLPYHDWSPTAGYSTHTIGMVALVLKDCLVFEGANLVINVKVLSSNF